MCDDKDRKPDDLLRNVYFVYIYKTAVGLCVGIAHVPYVLNNRKRKERRRESDDRLSFWFSFFFFSVRLCECEPYNGVCL